MDYEAGTNKKADPLRSAFLRDPLNGSGHLNLPVIPIWRNKILPTGVEIVRPPLHHLRALIEVLRLVDIGGAHVVTFLMAHLPLHGIFRPAPGLDQRATGHRSRDRIRPLSYRSPSPAAPC